ncbi:13837_t:CDS:2, partial [Racocetra persica]
TLADNLGCFPHVHGAYPPQTDYQIIDNVLQLYRGEPAISRFDRHFTTNHKSSEVISTNTGSALHEVSSSLQPAHG